MGVLEDKLSKINRTEPKGDLLNNSSDMFKLSKFFAEFSANEVSYKFKSFDINNNEDLMKSSKEDIYDTIPEESNIQKLRGWPKGYVSGENWNKVINLHSKVAQITKDIVSCECLIDKENQIFEVRNFTKEMFSHLDNLFEGKLILVSIKTKPGSSRIDIHNGDGLVDENLFNLEDEWKDLENSGLDKPLNKPLKF